MIDGDTAALLFGLEGVSVACVAPDESGILVLVLVTACADGRCCPGCGVRSVTDLISALRDCERMLVAASASFADLGWSLPGRH